MAKQGVSSSETFDDAFDSCRLSVEWHGYVETNSDWHQQIFPAPWTRLYFVLDGEGEFIFDGGSMKIEGGYVYLAPCGLPYGYRGSPSVKKLFFHINLTMPDGRDLFSSQGAGIVRFKRSGEKLAKLMEWYYSDDPADHILLKAEIWRAVAEAAAELGQDGQNISYSETLLSAIRYIRENLRAGLTAGEVAEAVFCSSGGLCERFKREMGMTVAKYIDSLLMAEASRRLLADGKSSIGEISAELGYCDQFYFSHCFAKHFKVSPKEYRKLRGST